MREQYLAAGMDDFLSKPFDRTELLAVVERWLADVADTAPAAVASTPAAAAAPARAETAAPRSAVLDADKIRELAEIMSRDEFTKLMTTWLKSTRERVDQIVALAKTDNFAAVRAHAHNLVSTAGGFGAMQLSDLARRLEEACHDGNLAAARELAQAIGAAAEPAREAVRACVAPAGA